MINDRFGPFLGKRESGLGLKFYLDNISSAWFLKKKVGSVQIRPFRSRFLRSNIIYRYLQSIEAAGSMLWKNNILQLRCYDLCVIFSIPYH